METELLIPEVTKSQLIRRDICNYANYEHPAAGAEMMIQSVKMLKRAKRLQPLKWADWLRLLCLRHSKSNVL